jgi:hypothetical protein
MTPDPPPGAGPAATERAWWADPTAIEQAWWIDLELAEERASATTKELSQ